MSQRPEVARVMFDESHSQAWTIRPEVARTMQPSHPEDSSLVGAAELLRGRDLDVGAHVSGPLDGGALEGVAVLVIAHPSEPAWERTVPGGSSPRLSADELDAVEAFVAAGGGLVLLGESEQEKYGNNLNELAGRFGIQIGNDTVSDYDADRHHQAPHWVLAEIVHRDGSDPMARVREACFYRSATLELGEMAQPLALTGPQASTPNSALLAVTEHGRGRVVVAGDSDLFGDDCIGDFDHGALWMDLVHWAGRGAFARPLPEAEEPARDSAEWAALKREVDELRLLQEPDGSVPADRDRTDLGGRVERIVAALEGLRPHFPHQGDYLGALVTDLRAWVVGDYGVPDFTSALEQFRPDLQREDDIRHLVLFPMYKQNGSRDRVFEALIVSVPWPDWLAELERTRYDNPKFVPVTLVDNTAGYDGDCAVLFPETVSAAGKPANHFGGIFCDREATRFRASSTRAVELLRCNLPADAEALLASESLSRDAFELWDLIHDRAHSHGDLPFDPFMIRQRMPYWMYSLEELRCDMTAFAEAVELERGGFAFARHVQYAILFDRLFRFPITGPRVRNYDGLGGQLLFGFLHATGRLHWTDNRLTIDWAEVADGVLALREEIESLYRAGIRRSKVGHWAAAHDLVSDFVPPASGTRWASDVREFADVEDPRPYIDEVLDDEFPLSLFYVSLQSKLDPA